MTRLTILNDNVPGKGLLNDWGWSILIEGKERFIFDANTNPTILKHNSEVLNVSLEGLDFAVLSHWHYDHYTGFPYIAELNREIDFYIPPGNFSLALKWGFNPIEIREGREISKGIWSSGALDNFEHAIGVEGKEGLIVIVGCSHPGVDRLTRAILDISGYDTAYLVIGGFHFPSTRVLDRLAEIAKKICPAHCSGDLAKAYVKKKYSEKFFEVKTGSQIII